MNRIVHSIRNRLSLRPPQADSLEILAELAEHLNLAKGTDLAHELSQVKERYPTCSDFERNFPSICFSLATGVGKTRLMGAFITYLYLAKGIRNFFVLSPNLTIYNKLIEDFSNSTSPKYVFHGIGEFVNAPPRIITGDNYNQARIQLSAFDSININVFNISKINSETRGGSAPRIKRLSEYLGDSYFNYLAELDDLVLLMDESHHYRADRGMEVLNELKPILGLEVTATPQVEKGNNTIKFKNVVFEYSLAKAIEDGFVKEPAVATRKNFDPSQYSAEELDRIKLEDGIRLHEDTKVALDIFARDTGARSVKPFVLVVAKDTSHAAQLMQMIKSPGFFDGNYADKVIEIHSSQKGEEKEENIQQLLNLEHPLNKVEIVVHVNMLKEGWDVTNLYTIIPLRTAASMTLREQTIGRGLRLPYGKRTGNSKVDKLTIVAHDKFQEIIEEANKPGSIIKLQNVIEIDEQEIAQKKEVLTVKNAIETRFVAEEARIATITQPEEQQKARVNLEAHKTLVSILPQISQSSPAVKSIHDLKKSEVKDLVVQKVREYLATTPQQNMFAEEIVQETMAAYEAVVEEFTLHTIEIPRIALIQANEIKSGFHDFDLDTRNLNYQPISEEILVRFLREQENATDVVVGHGRIRTDRPEKLIVNELINAPKVDYDEQADLLFKLAGQAIQKLSSYLSEEDALNVVQYHKRDLAKFIYAQMEPHFYSEVPKYLEPRVLPFTRIEEHNFSKYSKDSIHHFRDTITPTSAIPGKVFSGFKKACHQYYKFDSKTEKDFAALLEDDQSVLRWMRPAHRQFSIYWHHNSKEYHPDFVAETESAIYLVETKKELDISTKEVQEKSQAALQYCRYASDYTASNGGKPWRYVLIPHNAVLANMSAEFLFQKFMQESGIKE